MTTLSAYLTPTFADLSANVGTTPLPGIRVYLGAAASEDPILLAWYSAAVDWVSQKLSERDFVDSDGVDIQPPDACTIGVYEFVRFMRDYNARPAVGVKKVKTGAREEEYGDAGVNAMIGAGQAAWPYIEPYVEDPTLFASGGM